MGRNITLKLDESVLKKARIAAVESDKSVSEWVADLILHATLKRERHESAKSQAIKRLKQGFHLGGAPLSRDDIYG